MIVYALTLGDFDVWRETALVLRLRLNQQERACLAFAALKTCPEEIVPDLFNLSTPGAGGPLPALLSFQSDAAWWAGVASNAELEAYCVTCMDHLSPSVREKLLCRWCRGQNV